MPSTVLGSELEQGVPALLVLKYTREEIPHTNGHLTIIVLNHQKDTTGLARKKEISWWWWWFSC